MPNKWVTRAAVAAAGCVAYATLIEPRHFVVRRVSVPVLPPGAPPIRVLHLSDIHALRRNRARLGFVATLAGLEPDLVIDTGDNIAQGEAIEPLRSALGRLLDIPGAYVFGSSDYEAPVFRNPLGYVAYPSTHELVDHEPLPTGSLDAMLSAGAWRNVGGRRVILEVMGLRIELRGTDDAHVGQDEYPLVAGPVAPGVDVSLGVTHAPYRQVLDEMAADGVDLVFAGHTHGGQVCLPVFGAIITNCDLERHHAKGLFRHHAAHASSWVHVSAGLGTSPYAPYRFACPPEVTLLTLTPRSNG